MAGIGHSMIADKYNINDIGQVSVGKGIVQILGEPIYFEEGCLRKSEAIGRYS